MFQTMRLDVITQVHSCRFLHPKIGSENKSLRRDLSADFMDQNCLSPSPAPHDYLVDPLDIYNTEGLQIKADCLWGIGLQRKRELLRGIKRMEARRSS